MATDGWYEPAIGDYADSNGGAFVGPVTIGVMHTTESPVGKYRSGGGSNYGNFGHTSFPHFTVDVQGGKCVVFQHISIRKAAKALRNTSGGAQTNREGCIQIEVVGTATKPFTARTDAAVLVAGLAKLMRWIESQTKIPPRATVGFVAYPASYGTSAKQRMSEATWEAYAGWCGHQHVPENSHGDPGAIDFKKLLPAPVAAPAQTTTTSTKEAPVPAPTLFRIIDKRPEAGGGTQYVTDLIAKRWIRNPAELRDISASLPAGALVLIDLEPATLDAIPTVGAQPPVKAA